MFNIASDRTDCATDGGRTYLDRLLDALGHRRRRLLLYELSETETDVLDIEDAATRIAARERDVPVNSVSDDDEVREHVLLSLYHGHVPRLSELGIIDYDSRTGTIRFYDPPDELESLFEVLRGLDDSSHA